MRIINRENKKKMETTISEIAGERSVRNEHGVALIVALVMLVLLSILGAFALSTSSSDLFIAGNYRNAQDAFYSAEGARERAEMDESIYSAIVPYTKNTWPDSGDYNDIPVGSTTAKGRVEWITYGPLPPNMATDADLGSGSGSSYQASYYIIRVTGKGRANTKAEIALETEILKIVPK
jgi:type II secretory pathway pseudopilin PulG